MVDNSHEYLKIKAWISDIYDCYPQSEKFWDQEYIEIH